MKISSTATLLAIPAVARCLPTNGTLTTKGAVFVMTNNAADNEVVAFSRDIDGKLKEARRFSTGGQGIGVDFDTQGGLALDAKNKFLYALSPGSDSVTVFAVNGANLQEVQKIYAGDQPQSITLSSTGYAYVLDSSVASTGIFGFKVGKQDGKLNPITNSTISLSTPIGVPGVVTFSPDGRSLVVANKVGSTLDVFAIGQDGAATGPVTVSASSGLRPFAAAFKDDTLYVVESGFPAFKNSAVSSYRLNNGSVPSLTPITKSERNDQTDSCWINVTPDGKYLYTANFVSGTISSYTVAADGNVKLLKGEAAKLQEGSEPVDLGLGGDGKFLYNLLRGTGAVVAWSVEADGSLKRIGGLFGDGIIPKANGASGLAAY